GISVAEHTRALGPHLVAVGENIVDLVADVVNAAVGIAFEKLRDWGILAERYEQLDLGIPQRDKNRVHAVIRLRHHGGHVRAERVTVELARFRDIADRNGDVIETADHVFSLCPARDAARSGASRAGPPK